MSASMAELLGTHAAIGPEVDGVPEGEMWCNNIACGFKMRASDYDYDDMQDFAAHQAEVLAANGYGKLEEGCDRSANVSSDGFEFLPTCLGCGETLVHDYYHGELVYRHKETQ